jgi:hypothetical protein
VEAVKGRLHKINNKDYTKKNKKISNLFWQSTIFKHSIRILFLENSKKFTFKRSKENNFSSGGTDSTKLMNGLD